MIQNYKHSYVYDKHTRRNMSFIEGVTEIYPPKQLEVADQQALHHPSIVSETMCNIAHKTDFLIFPCGHHLKHGGEKPNEKASS